MELPAALEADGVDDEVGVEERPVRVGGHEDLVALPLLRQLQCDPVRQLRRDWFLRMERLNEVIVFHTVSLSVHLSCIFEFLICSQQRTIESRHKLFILGLVIAADVVETFLSAATAFRAYRCDRRHYFTSRSS